MAQNIGLLLQEGGQPVRAFTLFEASFNAITRSLGETNLFAGEILSHAAAALLDLGELDQAEICALRSLDIFGATGNRDREQAIDSYAILSRILLAKCQNEKAGTAASMGLEVADSTLPEFHERRSNLLELYAYALFLRGQHVEAFSRWRTLFAAQKALMLKSAQQMSVTVVERMTQAELPRAEILHSACGLAELTGRRLANQIAATETAFRKCFAEEFEAAWYQSIIGDKERLLVPWTEYIRLTNALSRVESAELDPIQRIEARHRLEQQVADVQRLIWTVPQEKTIGRLFSSLTNNLVQVAARLRRDTALIDIVDYQRWDFTAQKNHWREQRYAAYVTFPLANGSTNVLVERVDLGEAALIDQNIDMLSRRMAKKQFATKDLAAALQQLSDLIYRPLAALLTNVDHIIICPDGQLSRLPFEMLPIPATASQPNNTHNRFWLEEKTISYVGSGREIIWLAGKAWNSDAGDQESPSLVIGNPDFDFDYGSKEQANRPHEIAEVSAPSSLSRDYHGFRFESLPGAEDEARSVAKILGPKVTLLLGAAAREAQLKQVRSPRVLHLAIRAATVARFPVHLFVP